MASKAKSGLSAVRQFPESILQPPNIFTPGATSFSSPIRDGRGHSEYHVAATNATSFTLKVLHAWRDTGPFVLDQSVTSSVDPETGKHIAEIISPLTRRFIKILIDAPTPGLSAADFEVGAYFLPRSSGSTVTSGSGGSGASPVKGSPGSTIGPTPADVVIGIGATVALPAIPANTRRMTIQNTGPSGSLIRVREVGAGAGRGLIVPRFGMLVYGGADGAIAALEAEEVAGIATSATISFERD